MELYELFVNSPTGETIHMFFHAYDDNEAAGVGRRFLVSPAEVEEREIDPDFGPFPEQDEFDEDGGYCSVHWMEVK